MLSALIGVQTKIKINAKDTDHSFYLLARHVVDYCRAAILQHWTVGEQRVDAHFCCDADVASLLVVERPFRYVQKPFGRTQVLEHVRNLKQ